MTDYFETLSCTGTGSATFITQTNKILDATATAIATKIAQPTHVFSVTAVSVPVILKTVIRTMPTVVAVSVSRVLKMITRTMPTVVVVSVPKLLKLPGKVFLTTGSHTIRFFAERFGATSFDELIASNKWFIAETGRWSINVVQRFVYAVKGRL